MLGSALAVGVGMGLAVVGLPGSALAISSTPATTVGTVTVGSTITLTGLTPTFTMTGNPGETVVSAAAVTYNVKTNNFTGYSVTAEALAATMVGAIVEAPVSIPIANLKVKETSAADGTYVSLSSTAAVQIHTQATASIEAGDALSSTFQLLIPFVRPDTYSVSINYVATTLP